MLCACVNRVAYIRPNKNGSIHDQTFKIIFFVYSFIVVIINLGLFYLGFHLKLAITIIRANPLFSLYFLFFTILLRNDKKINAIP